MATIETLITIVIVCMIPIVAFVWRRFNSRISDMESWRLKSMEHDEYLTTVAHGKICKEANKDLLESMSEKFSEQKLFLETKFEAIDLKIENKILKELTKLNGRASGH